MNRPKNKSLLNPKEALRIARRLASLGLYQIGNPNLAVDLANLGFPGSILMQEAICAALDEADPASFKEDVDPQVIPAYIFIWDSKCFGRRIYFKFKLKNPNSKPVLWIYSCHEAHF